jgi:energy-coupling factor transport system permease protein
MKAALPREVHPVAWWVWGIGLAAAASQTTNPLVLVTMISVACVVVGLRRSDQPWAGVFRLYLIVGAVIVVMRVLFRILLGSDVESGRVLLDLPEIPLPDAVLGLRLLGPVTQEAVLAGLYDGLRLATIVICVGAANALANPKRLLRHVPSALYEIGTALVVAVTVIPQFAESARRVRRAQQLRAGDERRTGRLRRFLVPVLEDGLDRSLRLAAGMDTRGYGRSGAATAPELRTTGAFMLIGLMGICVGVYAALDQTAPRLLATPMLVLGVGCAFVGLMVAGRRVTRTRYRPDPWRAPEVVLIVLGLAVAVLMGWVSRQQVVIAYPGLDTMPTLTPAALVAALLGLVAAAATPPSPRETHLDPAPEAMTASAPTSAVVAA